MDFESKGMMVLRSRDDALPESRNLRWAFQAFAVDEQSIAHQVGNITLPEKAASNRSLRISV